MIFSNLAPFRFIYLLIKRPGTSVSVCRVYLANLNKCKSLNYNTYYGEERSLSILKQIWLLQHILPVIPEKRGFTVLNMYEYSNCIQCWVKNAIF